VQDLPVTTTPAPVYDPVENFEIDRELGLVPEWDVYVPPFENSFDFASENSFDFDFFDDALFGDFGWGGGGGGFGSWRGPDVVMME
jgi:hypothetical protein